MKKETHPTYHKLTATCACGGAFETGSTKEEIRVDICSNCHPLFTGEYKILDAEGRVERFKKRYAKAEPTKSKKKS